MWTRPMVVLFLLITTHAVADEPPLSDTSAIDDWRAGPT